MNVQGHNKSINELVYQVEDLVNRTKKADLPDEDLRLEWFELSERKGLSQDLRDFALDAMLTAEDFYPVFKSTDDLAKHFVEKIRPLLAVKQQGS